jgi:YfiH family protein
VFYKDSQNIYRVEPLDAFDWLVHGFGTRWSNSFGSCGNLATVHQIHSDIVIHAGGRSGSLGDGDALIENTPGRLIAVKTADCIPILIVDPRQHAVAAVHAGWRGTVQKIAARAVQDMQRRFSSRPDDLLVAIGPGIGKCCYEVGPEVAQQFAEFADSTRRVDLSSANRRQVADSGVPLDHIYTTDLCTMCDSDFHSFRRDKRQAGRMSSVVGIKHQGRENPRAL